MVKSIELFKFLNFQFQDNFNFQRQIYIQSRTATSTVFFKIFEEFFTQFSTATTIN